jgi:hypothetical protein
MGPFGGVLDERPNVNPARWLHFTRSLTIERKAVVSNGFSILRLDTLSRKARVADEASHLHDGYWLAANDREPWNDEVLPLAVGKSVGLQGDLGSPTTRRTRPWLGHFRPLESKLPRAARGDSALYPRPGS